MKRRPAIMGKAAQDLNMLDHLYHMASISIPMVFELIRKPSKYHDLKTRKRRRAKWLRVANPNPVGTARSNAKEPIMRSVFCCFVPVFAENLARLIVTLRGLVKRLLLIEPAMQHNLGRLAIHSQRG